MATIWGNNLDDILTGTPNADFVYGLGGNDTLDGDAGEDELFGGPGADRLFGQDGNDILRGEAGNDQLFGGNGDDRMFGGDGNDRLIGGFGDDKLFGGNGADYLDAWGIGDVDGGAGNDTIVFNPGSVDIDAVPFHNTFEGGAGFDVMRITNNTISSGSPNRVTIFHDETGTLTFALSPHIGDPDQTRGTISGVERIEVSGSEDQIGIGLVYTSSSSATDSVSPDITVVGTSHDDVLGGGTGDETFIGGGGNDFFFSGSGNDVLQSDADDSDIFSFIAFTSGDDVVTGFNGAGSADGDILRFNAILPSDVAVSESGDSTLFSWSGGTVTVDATGLVAGLDYMFP